MKKPATSAIDEFIVAVEVQNNTRSYVFRHVALLINKNAEA